MSFIGIIAEGKHEKYIENILHEYLEQHTVIHIHEKNIENMKNVTFETVLISGSNTKIFNKVELVKQVLSKAKYLIINADIETNLEVLDNLNLKVITFGFNSKSTITVSSIKDDSCLICLQRNLVTIKNKEVEPQEIRLEMDTNVVNLYSAIGATIVLIIYGVQDIKLGQR